MSEIVAAVVTTSQTVYTDVSVTLRRMGMGRILHLAPKQLLEAPRNWFWVMDGRVPGALPLASALMKQGRTNGFFFSTAMDMKTTRALVEMGVPSMQVHRRVELPEDTAGANMLSSRELQVLQVIADTGGTNNSVGLALGLSGATIKSHLARIGHKLKVDDRAHMVAVAWRAGLIR